MAKQNNKEAYTGFVVEFEPERSSRLAEWMSAGYDFSDSYSSDDWSLRRKEIFFVLSPKLDHGSQTLLAAVYVERMHGTGGTRKPKYRFTRPVLFKGAISFHEFEQSGIDFSGLISNSSKGIRLLLEFWNRLITTICVLRAGQAEDLAQLLILVNRDTQLLGGTNRLDRLAEQRDAVGMVLDLAGLDRSAMLKTVDAAKSEEADVFFDLLTNHPYQERSLIEHDEYWLQQLLSEANREMQFQDGESGAKVKVRITDKEPLETALGVDLLFISRYITV